MQKYIYLSALGLLIASGCTNQMHNSLAAYNKSVNKGYFEEAAQRLERCTKSLGEDAATCKGIFDSLQHYNLPLSEAIKKKGNEEASMLLREKEAARLSGLRKSNNPWDLLNIVIGIQSGEITRDTPNEETILLEKAFFEFGNCAKLNQANCMSQYAQMILWGMREMPQVKQQDARKKALYWLNLSARYGDDNARRILLGLEESIPSPDLAMEKLQKEANNLAQNSITQQIYYNNIISSENTRINLMSALSQVFPRAVNCTSNSLGSSTYTKCY